MLSLGHKALFICLQYLCVNAGSCILGEKTNFHYLPCLLYKASLPLPLSCQSRRHSWDLSWPFIDPPKYVRDRATRNVSRKSLQWWLSIIFQGTQLSHKSQATCLHHVFVMETYLPALRWRKTADVASLFFELMTSKQSAPLNGSLMILQTHSASPSQLPPSQKLWFGGEKEKQQKKANPRLLPLKKRQGGKVPWIPIAKTHTTWKEERKENPIWDFKRKVEHIHTQYSLAKEPTLENVAAPTCCAQRRC